MRCFFSVIVLAVVTMACLAPGNIHAQSQKTNSETETQQAAHVPLPVEAFTKYDIFSGIKLSPSGKYAVILGGRNGRSHLIFTKKLERKYMNALLGLLISI